MLTSESEARVRFWTRTRNTKHLFLSYARADRRPADRLVASLRAAGFVVWRDVADIRSGSHSQASIAEAIRQSEAVILVVSRRSMSSDFVRREVDVAVSARIRVIPLMLQAVPVPPELQLQLAGLQMIDLSKRFRSGVSRLPRDLEVSPRLETRLGATGPGGSSVGRWQAPESC